MVRGAHGEVELEPLDPHRAEVLALAAGAAAGDEAAGRDLAGSQADRDVGDRVVEVVEEGVGRPAQPRARVANPELAPLEGLGIEPGVGLGDVVAHPERAVQLVDGRRPERAVERAQELPAVGRLPDHAHARAEVALLAVLEGLVAQHGAGVDGAFEPHAVLGAPHVEAAAQRQGQPVAEPDRVLDPDPAELLVAPGETAVEEGAVDEAEVLVGGALGGAQLAAAGHRVPSEQAGPLQGAAQRLGVDQELVERRRLRAPVFRLGAEGRRELLVLDQQAADPRAAAGGALDVVDHRHQLGVVVGERRAVATLLVERLEPPAPAPRIPERDVDPPVDGGVLGRGGHVDRAALVGAHHRVAVGVEQVAVDPVADPVGAVGPGEVELGRPALPRFRQQAQAVGLGARGEQLDDAAERRAPPRARAAAAHDLDALQRLPRDPAPVHPATERVVERGAVEQHQGAADAARADAAQRHPLGGRLRHHRAGAPEQREARRLAERVVDGDRARGGDLLPGEHRHVAGDVVDRLLEAAGGDHQRLLDPRSGGRRVGGRGAVAAQDGGARREQQPAGQGERRDLEAAASAHPCGASGSEKIPGSSSTPASPASTSTVAAGVPPVRISMCRGTITPSISR
jgi:hypothetical protein